MNVYSLLSIRSFLLLTALGIAIRGKRPDAARIIMHYISSMYMLRRTRLKAAIERWVFGHQDDYAS